MVSTISQPRRGFRARFWRLLLRLRYLLWQRRRCGRPVLERGLGLPLVILPEVFNPALYRTTPFVLECLGQAPVASGAQVLDLGTGSGVLALAAAARAARVVAVDLNPEAVRCTRINILLNGLDHSVEVRHGDLFGPVAGERFDLVICNPPYYAGNPTTVVDQAFYGGDFADRLAAGLAAHLTDGGQALVVLSSDGAEEDFLEAFRRESFVVGIVRSKNLISEVVTLYRVEK